MNSLPSVDVTRKPKIVEVPERTVAALRFSGRWSNSIFKKKSIELLAELGSAGVKVAGPVFSMRYNGSYTP